MKPASQNLRNKILNIKLLLGIKWIQLKARAWFILHQVVGRKTLIWDKALGSKTSCRLMRLEISMRALVFFLARMQMKLPTLCLKNSKHATNSTTLINTNTAILIAGVAKIRFYIVLSKTGLSKWTKSDPHSFMRLMMLNFNLNL